MLNTDNFFIGKKNLPPSNGVSSGLSPDKPSFFSRLKGVTLKTWLGVGVLAVFMVGSVAAFMLSSTGTELRQRASNFIPTECNPGDVTQCGTQGCSNTQQKICGNDFRFSECKRTTACERTNQPCGTRAQHGENFCSGNLLYKCNNGFEELIQTCPSGCNTSNRVCNPSICEEGNTRADCGVGCADQKQKQVCINGTWTCQTRQECSGSSGGGGGSSTTYGYRKLSDGRCIQCNSNDSESTLQQCTFADSNCGDITGGSGGTGPDGRCWYITSNGTQCLPVVGRVPPNCNQYSEYISETACENAKATIASQQGRNCYSPKDSCSSYKIWSWVVECKASDKLYNTATECKNDNKWTCYITNNTKTACTANTIYGLGCPSTQYSSKTACEGALPPQEAWIITTQ